MRSHPEAFQLVDGKWVEKTYPEPNFFEFEEACMRLLAAPSYNEAHYLIEPKPVSKKKHLMYFKIK
jgi:hypothetical protein